MANMTSENERSTREGEREGAPSTIERVAAGASTVTNQQLRKARANVDEQISSQRERITGRVRTLSRALKGAGEMLEEDDLVAQCLHYASDKVSGVAGYVEELDPSRAADDLRGLARDRPAWFFGGAFALGLALGRFARSTSEAPPSGTPRGGARPRTRIPSMNTGMTAGSSSAPSRARPPSTSPGMGPSTSPTSPTGTTGPTGSGTTRTGALRP